MSESVETLEFKLTVNKRNVALIDEWCDRLRSVWNSGLKLLEESQQRKWAKKHERPLPPGLVLQYRRGKFTGSGIRKTRNGYKYCPIRQGRDIEDPKKLFTSGSYYNNSNAPWLADIPSKFRTGVHKSLQEAWKRYQDPQHPVRRPRYKGKKDVLRSLANYNAGGKSQELKPVAITGTDNGYVQFPSLGKLHVKGLYRRFDATKPYGCAKIVCEPSGYYLQVTVESQEKTFKPCEKATGIDPGVAACITDDSGRQVRPANLLRKQLKRLRRLQRKAARQEKGSREQRRTYQKVGRLHEKVRRSRSAFNHKLSSKLVREYGAIAFEGSNLQNMTKKPKAKLREDGFGYEQNGAKRKAGLNRALADVAWGDLRAKTEHKAKVAHREFKKTEPRNSSKLCHRCRKEGDRPTQSNFYCLNVACTLYGQRQNADENASRNHLLNSGFLATEGYRTWDWVEAMPLTNSPVTEVNLVTEEARKSKRSKKQVKSPVADTDRKRQKRSHNGTPSEAAKPPHKDVSLAAPSCESTTPTINFSSEFPECANQEVSKTCNLNHKPKALTNQSFEQLQLNLEVPAVPENLAGADLKQSRKRRRKGKISSSGQGGRSFAQLPSEMLTQLDLWSAALETSVEEG